MGVPARCDGRPAGAGELTRLRLCAKPRIRETKTPTGSRLMTAVSNLPKKLTSSVRGH